MNMAQLSKTRKFITSVAVLVVVTFLVIGAKAFDKKTVVAVATPSVTTQPTTPASGAANGSYKDGTYQATGKYSSPGGTQSVVVSLTIANDTVTGSTAQGQAQDGVAQIYQSDFVNGYKKFVIGKKLTEIRISHISGSSLTSKGFNSALQQIEKQAKA
jgi:uncharacterized protein with FMN-binding domain